MAASSSSQQKAGAASAAAPVPISVNPNAILIRESQLRNPVLDFIKNVPFEVCPGISPDFIVGGSSCVLYLCLNFHLLHPTYIKQRMSELGKNFVLRVIVVHVDTDDNVKSLGELNALCFSMNFTLLLAWSLAEAGRYIETLKAYEKKSTISIQEKVETDFIPQLTSILTKANYINRTDVVTLLESFGSFRNLCSATDQQMILCPGMVSMI